MLIDIQVLMLHKAFTKGWSVNIRFLKIQLYEIVKAGRTFFRFLGKLALGDACVHGFIINFRNGQEWMKKDNLNGLKTSKILLYTHRSML